MTDLTKGISTFQDISNRSLLFGLSIYSTIEKVLQANAALKRIPIINFITNKYQRTKHKIYVFLKNTRLLLLGYYFLVSSFVFAMTFIM